LVSNVSRTVPTTGVGVNVAVTVDMVGVGREVEPGKDSINGINTGIPFPVGSAGINVGILNASSIGSESFDSFCSSSQPNPPTVKNIATIITINDLCFILAVN
jgi:hypothetical protein